MTDEEIIEDKYVTEILTNCTTDNWEVNGVKLAVILRKFLFDMNHEKLVHAMDAIKYFRG